MKDRQAVTFDSRGRTARGLRIRRPSRRDYRRRHRREAPQVPGPGRPLVGRLGDAPVDLRNGWLAFQSDTEWRQLAPIPEGWTSLSDAELLSLLEAAHVTDRSR